MSTVSFKSDLNRIHVPAKSASPWAKPPSREVIISIRISDDYYLPDSDYYNLEDVNEGGLTDNGTHVKKIGNDVIFIWRMRNRKTFPVNGRTAKLRLVVNAKKKYTYEKPVFGSSYKLTLDRFLAHFYHKGQVASHYVPKSDTIVFADQLIYSGQALILFSSIYIVGPSENERKNSVDKVAEILNVIESQLEVQPGYILRDNISKTTNLNKIYKEVKSDYQAGKDNEPSQDQYIGLLIGLTVVSKTTRNIFREQLTRITTRMMDYLIRNKFILRNPDGKKVARGEDARAFSTLINGISTHITGVDRFNEIDINIPGGRKIVASIWDSEALAGIMNLIGETNQDKHYVSHMILILLSSSNNWSQQKIEEAIKSNPRHLLSAFLWAFIHDKVTQTISWINEVEGSLKTCQHPPSSKASHWNKDNIWIRGGFGRADNHGSEVWYNGLDYLTVHNLSQITNGRSLHL